MTATVLTEPPFPLGASGGDQKGEIMRTRVAHFVGAAAMAAGLLAAVPSNATAEPAAAGAEADYEGQRINLRKEGWRGAHTCVVTTPQDIDCYGKGSEADAALGYDRSADTKALPACARGWLCLYEHVNGGGRRRTRRVGTRRRHVALQPWSSCSVRGVHYHPSARARRVIPCGTWRCRRGRGGSVSRVVSRLSAAAVTTALTVTAALTVLWAGATVPAAARPQPVDPETGPVAFANVASMAIADDGYGRPGGSVISETQRSPLTPGVSRLGESRSALPASEGERAAVGPNYRLDIEHHDVAAGLGESGVPEASARADFVLTDLATDVTVLAFERAGTSAECVSAAEPESGASASRLSVTGADGVLRPVSLPEPGEEVRRQDLPFGAPVEIGEDEAATSDLRIRPVTEFGQLLRQRQWREGEVTAASGWLVEIHTHVRPAEPEGDERFELPVPAEVTEGTEDTEGTSEVPTAGDGERHPARTVETTFVLGGVSCSVPRDFVSGGGGQAEPGAPSVPVTIPAGVGAPGGPLARAEARAEGSDARSATTMWGTALLAGGGVLGLAALFLARRASSSRTRP